MSFDRMDHFPSQLSGGEQERVKVIIHFDEGELARLRRERNLGVGYRTRVQIITAEKPDTLTVPRASG